MRPLPPQKPILVSVDETEIKVILPQTLNDNGAVILTYNLYINEGADGSAFNLVANLLEDYDGTEMTYPFSAGD